MSHMLYSLHFYPLDKRKLKIQPHLLLHFQRRRRLQQRPLHHQQIVRHSIPQESRQAFPHRSRRQYFVLTANWITGKMMLTAAGQCVCRARKRLRFGRRDFLRNSQHFFQPGNRHSFQQKNQQFHQQNLLAQYSLRNRDATR